VYHKSHLSYLVIIFTFPSSRLQVRFVDEQPFFIHQSALQINFPLHQQQQQQFDTQSRHLDEQQQQQLLQQDNLHQHHQPVAQGYIDESGNLCIIEYPETADVAVGATNTNSLSIAKSLSRHGTREKTRSSQKRRKRRKAKQQPAKEANKKDFGEFSKEFIFKLSTPWPKTELILLLAIILFSLLIFISIDNNRFICAKFVGKRRRADTVWQQQQYQQRRGRS
jgi:hypothetical protein